MENYRRHDSDPSLNGMGKCVNPTGGPGERKYKAYKLMVDPAMRQGPTKVYRFDGVGGPGDPPVFVRDPRSRMKRFWTKREPANLTVPKFLYDIYYVGTPLPKEVTFTNLNDNIDVNFLDNMCKSFGNIEDVKIYFHPKTKKHTGVGKVLFSSTRAARTCAEKLHNTSKMGNIITVFVDTMGTERQKILEDLTAEREPPPPPTTVISPQLEARRRFAADRFREREGRGHPHTPHSDVSGYSTISDHLSDKITTPSDSGYSMGPPATPHTPHTPHSMGFQDNYSGMHGFNPPASNLNMPPPGHNQWNTPHGPQTPQDSYGQFGHSHRDREYDSHDRHGRRDGRDRDRRRKERRDSHERRRHDRDRHGNHREGHDRDENREWRHHRSPPPRPPSPNNEHSGGLSLESRIQSLLRRDSESSHHSEDEGRRHSVDEPPPLPPEMPPPLPSEEPPPPEEDLPPPPPLPPEPPEEEQAPAPPPDPPFMSPNEHKTLSLEDRIRALTGELDEEVVEETVMTETVDGDNDGPVNDDDDEDRMSLSSISSGEEKIDVNVSTNQVILPDISKPPPNLVGWNNYNNTYNFSDQAPMVNPSLIMTAQDEANEKMFYGALEKLIVELKDIMKRDLQKKMVQNSAFLSFDTWWDEEEKKRQPAKALPIPKAPIKNGAPIMTAAKKDMSSTLAALFDKDKGISSGFGMGGLLGLRGGLPKLPSFRVAKRFRPPSPPPEDEDTVGPKTPPESDEEDLDVDVERKTDKTKRPVIYSSDSDEEESEKSGSSEGEESSEEESESEDGEEEESSEEEEEEDQEQTTDREDSQVEGSDIEVGKPESPKIEREDAKHAVTVEAAEKPEAANKEIGKPKEDAKPQPSTSKAEEPMELDDKEERKVDEKAKVETEPEKTDGKSEKFLSPGEVKVEKAEPDTPPSDKSKRRLSDREKGACDMLLEMQMRSPDIVSPTNKQAKTEDALRRPSVAEQEVANDSERGLEQDAVLALLQMHDNTPNGFVAEKPKATPSPEVSKSHYTMAAEHNYFQKPAETGESDQTDSASEGEQDLIPTLPPEIQIDHNYCLNYFPEESKKTKDDRKKNESSLDAIIDAVIARSREESTVKPEFLAPPPPIEEKPKKQPRQRKDSVRRIKKLKDVTNLKDEPIIVPKPKPTFKPRALQEEMQVTYDFLIHGIDEEDSNFLKRRYDEMLGEDNIQNYWLNDTHWVDHTHTSIPDPPKKKRKVDLPQTTHTTGSARTEGYYKISLREKARYLHSARGVLSQDHPDTNPDLKQEEKEKVKKQTTALREAKFETRRIQNVLSAMGEDLGDLLKFNLLQFRKKQLKFARSGIHDWGLFALERIAAEEMVIEYVGAVIRQTVADLREKQYENSGIGSSYLFRIDHELVIDATKTGNLARFINHSCNPNCYAKIITVKNEKKIVIYSKREIDVNEEITYDYKFPIEEEKITCLCGAPGCRGTLN